MLCLLATPTFALAPSRLVDVAPLAPSRLFRHATPQPLRAEEEAFLAAISCDGDDEARAQRIYATYGKQGDQEGTHGVRPRRRRRCGTAETPSTR